jgi:hypothetical protein
MTGAINYVDGVTVSLLVSMKISKGKQQFAGKHTLILIPETTVRGVDTH